MAHSHTFIRLLVAETLLACTGCVVVNPSNVRVSGFNSDRADSGPPATPYASTLQSVIEQQSAVRTELDARDWVEAGEEIDDWVTDTRKLMGYADTTHDPRLFRAYCNELLAAFEPLHRAVARQDPVAARERLEACNPILNKLSRDFPLTATTPPPSDSGSGATPDRQSSRVP